MHRRDSQPQHGTSLIELITVVAILAIALGLSLPGLGNLRLNQNMNSARSQLTLSLAQARISAVTRGGKVVMCPSADGERCMEDIFWHHGWLLFADTNHNDRHDAGEERIGLGTKVQGVYIASTTGRRRITYLADGSSPGSNITLTLCDQRGASKATALVINNAGRVRLAAPTEANTVTACAGS